MMVVHTGLYSPAVTTLFSELPENLVILAAAMFAWCISPGAQFDIC